MSWSDKGWGVLRENRFLVSTFGVLLVLLLGAVYLLQRTQEASPQELTNTLLLFVLWYLDVSLILVLLFILVRNVVKLILERRSGVLGSQFKTKLVVTYVGLTFVPVIFIFLVANNILQRSIDRWFAAPVEQVLRSGAVVTEQLRVLVEQRLKRQAEVAAVELATDSGHDAMQRLHRLLGVDLVAVYVDGRRVRAVSDPRRLPTSVPPLELSVSAAGPRADRWRGGLLIRAWTQLASGEVVVVGAMLPQEILVHLERASAAHAAFQEMEMERGTITATTMLVFLAVTLMLLFATVWVGLYLSRRFTDPLLAVVTATRSVAEGSELEEVVEPASDEMGVLVASFNGMVRRLRSSEAEIRASNEELATLLATIPTGVLTVDPGGAQFRPNLSAARLLGCAAWAATWQPLSELQQPGLEPLVERMTADRLAEAKTEQMELEAGGSVHHLDVTVRPFPGGRWVVALDDLTQLVRAQRLAAWGEVARRIAHEIKNPLTPIRLAAERIQRRVGSAGVDDELQSVVDSGCGAIVAHVAGLKELVDAFHAYAKMPAVSPRLTDVKRLLEEVVTLYENVRPGVRVLLTWVGAHLQVQLDPILLRQAMVNLIDNSVEACGSAGNVSVTGEIADGEVVLVVDDDGPGLPTEQTEMLVQPFYSTKGRGSGMGLALVHRIVTDHGGTLELLHSDAGGARVCLRIPAVSVRNAPDQ